VALVGCAHHRIASRTHPRLARVGLRTCVVVVAGCPVGLLRRRWANTCRRIARACRVALVGRAHHRIASRTHPRLARVGLRTCIVVVAGCPVGLLRRRWANTCRRIARACRVALVGRAHHRIASRTHPILAGIRLGARVPVVAGRPVDLDRDVARPISLAGPRLMALIRTWTRLPHGAYASRAVALTLIIVTTRLHATGRTGARTTNTTATTCARHAASAGAFRPTRKSADLAVGLLARTTDALVIGGAVTVSAACRLTYAGATRISWIAGRLRLASTIALAKAACLGSISGTASGASVIRVVLQNFGTGSKTTRHVARPARCSAGTIATIAIHTVPAAAVNGK
jgi:hypothetical protein